MQTGFKHSNAMSQYQFSRLTLLRIGSLNRRTSSSTKGNPQLHVLEIPYSRFITARIDSVPYYIATSENEAFGSSPSTQLGETLET
ncbi:hypothetical protein TSUD_176020 [Trifolium subterraneum]|uniref:Uncharacterized protein n=1 Tax=Trifolium subterraneum TaxID=3900 RepID=A0A2Z6M071_TRISU|nr:hypothetical protein TSUD_176020 [Trifolium subterraneum]